MPFAVFKSVQEVTSEDPIHCAENLVKQQPGKKWKTKTSGEKSAYVILELDEPQQITGIDIGNEHSAFVEVLVGKAGCTRDDFTEIMITSSFMTPTESKNSDNPNRVRCFNQNLLVASALPDKWQKVKVLCTQPFNKHVAYGLSFIKLHVVEVAKKDAPAARCLVPEKFLPGKPSTELPGTSEQVSKPTGIQLGKFKLREDSPDSEAESSGKLFNRWKTARTSSGGDDGPSTAASIRQASSPASLRRLSESTPKPEAHQPTPPRSFTTSSEKQASDKEPPAARDRNRDQLLFGDDDDDETDGSAKEQRLTKQIEADRERLRRESDNLQKRKEKDKGKSIDQEQPTKKPTTPGPKPNGTPSTVKNVKKRRSSSARRPAKKPKPDSPVGNYRPFNELLRDVVLVISGIQNPERARLRGRAAALGARYKSDWEEGCTHLICAFKNTPKYNQVKGKGKIVTRKWIDQCYEQKKYLPWRRYALCVREASQDASDEEILAESLKPRAETDDDQPSVSHAPRDGTKNDTLAMYDLGNDDDMEGGDPHIFGSDSDTEDEIERALQKSILMQYEQDRANNILRADDVFEASTEEEDYVRIINNRQ